MAKPKEPIRNADSRQDLGALEAISYNDAAGAKKFILIEPVVKRPVAGNEIVGPGKYVKVTGTSYTLDLLGKAYAPASNYKKGDIVTEAGDVYMAQEDNVTGTFDASKWRKVALKVVGPVTIVAGAAVSTGRWHNTVTTAGFLVDDNS
ncbi:MAG TPA: hypothetical protein VMV86_00115, partial [Methanosarcinales archaeon]|nr:hypothetical protein [Methanosarcinales archaeon]